MRRVRTIVALAALALLVAASGASAGTYSVRLSTCPPGKPSAFALAAAPGLEAVADCEADLVAVHTGDAFSSVASKGSATATLTAPPGTSFRGIEWLIGYERPDCRWSVTLAADGVVLRGAKAFETCDVFGEIAEVTAGLAEPRTLSLQVTCEAPEFCPVPPPGIPDLWTPWSAATVLFTDGLVTLNDDVAPTVKAVGLGGPEVRWVRGIQPFRYQASDGSGIQETTLVLPGSSERHPAPCEYTHPTPCPNGDRELPVDTTRLADGVHSITAQVLDAAGNENRDTALAYVDNTAPAPVQPYVEGGSGWRRENAFTIGWDAASEAHAPVVEAHYRLCRADTGECVSGSRRGTGIDRLRDVTVPAAGEWTLETWREDEAGNVDGRLASPPVRLRLDNAPPAVAFEPRRLEDPRRVSAVVTDRLSGVASAEIQLRPAGGGPWQSLPSRLDQGRLSAEIDDDRLPAGAYELRAVARDQAGNDGATHTLPDGSAAVLGLPLRDRARLTAGIVKTRGKRKPRLLPSVTAALGQRLRLSGRLTNHLGRPVGGEQLHVYSQSRVGDERFAGAVPTNRAGEFSYRLRAKASGTIRIHYQGSRMLGKADRKIALGVRAASVLKVNARRVLNGDEVVFTGRLRGRPFPRPGKIIHLQAHYGRKGWSNFGKPHRARPNGRWRIPYRFDNTRGLVRYRFRVLVPRERDYPYETGASNVVRVTVRGR